MNGDSGRVQVFYNNTWGTVCSETWDSVDAMIVCRMLGFKPLITSVMAIKVGSQFGSASQLTPIWLSNIQCTGTESSLNSCPQATVGLHTCVTGHTQDAGVYCQG